MSGESPTLSKPSELIIANAYENRIIPTHKKQNPISIAKMTSKNMPLESDRYMIQIKETLSSPEPRTEMNNGKISKKIMRDNDTFFRIAASSMIQHIEEKPNEHIKVVSPSFAADFSDAVNFRMRDLPEKRSTEEQLVDALTRRCYEIGLGNAKESPLLMGRENAGVIIPSDRMFPSHSESNVRSYQPPSSKINMRETIEPRHQAETTSIFFPSTKKRQNPFKCHNRVRNAELTENKSIVRQKMMAEIKVATELMKISESNENKIFWRKHINNLQLQIMTGSNGLSTSESIDRYVDSNFLEVPCEEINRDDQEENIIWVDFVSPDNLPEGFTFEATMDNDRYLVTVPIGGLSKGKRMKAPAIKLDNNNHPTRQWINGIFGCFQYGPFHPMLCNSLFFPHIALGQIMERVELDWMGLPTNNGRHVSTSPCSVLPFLFFFWASMCGAVIVILYFRFETEIILTLADIIAVLIIVFMFVMFTVYLIVRTRMRIRTIDQIPGSLFKDFCAAVFCMGCTISQMGRHTGEYDMFSPMCCTETGLPKSVILPSVYKSPPKKKAMPVVPGSVYLIDKEEEDTVSALGELGV